MSEIDVYCERCGLKMRIIGHVGFPETPLEDMATWYYCDACHNSKTQKKPQLKKAESS